MTRTGSLWSGAVVVVMGAALYAQAPAQPPVPAPADAVRAFADALDTCTAGKVATAHPLMRSFVVEHTIAGEKDASCGYSQTMPGKMTMECKFSAAGRKAMAGELRASVAGGPMRGGTSQAQPEWAKECEIVTASGTRSPMIKK